MPLPEPAAGLTSRWLFPSLELFDRTRSCGGLESRTATEMTDRRVLRLGRRVTPPGITPTPMEGGDTLGLYCGIDWASDHHDIAVVDDDGQVVARGRVGNDAAGFAQALTLLAEAGDSADHPIPVGIETDHGLWVAALRETGRVIYPINPLAASRYRSRYAVSGAKSDATDAVLLANIVRTDAAAHRPLPADTELAQAIRVLARAQQDAVWARQQIGNQIRDLLKDFYPAALVAFAELPSGGLARPDARTILAAAPTPAQALKLTPARLRRLLVKAGRRRDLDRDIERLRAGLHRHLPAPTATRRKRHGDSADRAAGPVRRRLQRRRCAGRGGDRPF